MEREDVVVAYPGHGHARSDGSAYLVDCLDEAQESVNQLLLLTLRLLLVQVAPDEQEDRKLDRLRLPTCTLCENRINTDLFLGYYLSEPSIMRFVAVLFIGSRKKRARQYFIV